MAWYVASTVNVVPDDHYIFINNPTEVATAASGYLASQFTQYSKMDVVLVGGGGTGGEGGSGGEGLTGGGGGSGNRIGYIPIKYTDPSSGFLYDYTIAPGQTQTIILTSYTFSSIVVSVGTAGVETTLSLTGSTLTPLTAYAGSNGNFTGGGNGFNGGGSGGRKSIGESPGSGDTANGGKKGFGLSAATPGYGGGIGGGTGGPNGGIYYEGGGGGGSGVKITNSGSTIITGGNGNQAAPGYYSGGGGGGGTYSGGPGKSGAPGYAILRFYN